MNPWLQLTGIDEGRAWYRTGSDVFIMGDMECKATEQCVTVWLRGGPWDGFEVPGIFDHVEIYEAPLDELGALMPQPGDPEASHRAAYEPDTEGDPAVWRFVGWQ